MQAHGQIQFLFSLTCIGKATFKFIINGVENNRVYLVHVGVGQRNRSETEPGQKERGQSSCSKLDMPPGELFRYMLGVSCGVDRLI